MAGAFLVVGLGPESFASLPLDMIQKYTEQFKRPELFASINGQIVSVPVELENPLRTAEMALEDDYGMVDRIVNNDRRGEELEKAQAEARRTTPEKKTSIRERLEDEKREYAKRKGLDKPVPQKPPGAGRLMSWSKNGVWNGRSSWARTAGVSITSSVRAASTPASRVSGLWWCPAHTIFPSVPKSVGIRVQNRRRNRLWRLFRVGAV